MELPLGKEGGLRCNFDEAPTMLEQLFRSAAAFESPKSFKDYKLSRWLINSTSVD